MYKSLSHFIAELEKRGELVRITTFVDPVLEVAEITDRASKSANGGKALLFENTGTEFPILTNMMGSERRICLALGVESLNDVGGRIEELFSQVTAPRRNIFQKIKALPLLSTVAGFMPRHSSKKGDCQKVIIQNPDLSKLPILKCWPADGGRFVTLPLVHTRDITTGIQNVGMYRMQLFSDNTTGMHWHKHKTGARHYEEYKKSSRRMPVTVCLGGDPAYTYCATAPLPDGIDEYMLAGFLRKKSVKLVKCITNDLEVPADVDFVIEGYVDVAENKVVEGPFGDHTGFYSLEDLYPVFHVTCITHRRGAVYPATIVGVPPQEDFYLAKATENIFFAPIKFALVPEIVSLKMPMEGVAHNLAVVQIDKRYAGQGFKVASALWGAGQMAFCKYIVITDQEQWSFNGKTIAGELLFSRGVADILDHAGENIGQGGKLCIDTTSCAAKRYTIDILYDEGAQTLTSSEQLWLALANTDPERDIVVQGDKLTVDARAKQLLRRDFPNVVTMSDEIIEKVDGRWSEYGFSEFIESPSRRYKKLINGNGAININAKTADQ